MPGPPTHFTNNIDLTTYANSALRMAAMNAAWAAFFTTYGIYPDVWVIDEKGTLYIGGY